jgi:hypothetical protein
MKGKDVEMVPHIVIVLIALPFQDFVLAIHHVYLHNRRVCFG